MHLPQQDFFTSIIVIAIIGISLLCIQLGVKKNVLNKLIGRKLLHFSAISSCAFAIYQFENRLLLAWLFLVFFFVLLWVVSRGWMQVNEEKTYGIALFPLAFTLLLFIPAFHKTNIALAALILALSDAMAGVLGNYFGRQKVIFLAEKKTWVGFAAFYTSAFFVTFFFTGNYTWAGILFCITFAILPSLTELFSYRGSDNFTVPLLTAIWALLIVNADSRHLLHLWLLLFLFASVAFIAVQKKWLTISGAAAAVWMALLLFATGTFKAFIAPGIFLICGSLLSKLNRHQNEKTGRNARQVFANGITGIACMVVYKLTMQEVYLLAAVVSFCISMADTTSSELGIFYRGKTFDICTFKKMQPGLSGGISLQGTLAGLAGAVLLAAAAGYFYNFSFTTQLWTAAAGFTGMLADSLLGSLLQVKYKDENGTIIENKANGAASYSGYAWCTNDTVNLLSNLLITSFFLFIFHFLQ